MDLESILGINFVIYAIVLAQPWILPFLPFLCIIVGIAGFLLEAKSREEGMYLSEGTIKTSVLFVTSEIEFSNPPI